MDSFQQLLAPKMIGTITRQDTFRSTLNQGETDRLLKTTQITSTITQQQQIVQNLSLRYCLGTTKR